MTNFSERLNQAMEDSPLSWLELARLCEISQSTASFWKNKPSVKPAAADLLRAADALKVSPHWLAGISDTREPESFRLPVQYQSEPASGASLRPRVAAIIDVVNPPQMAIAMPDFIAVNNDCSAISDCAEQSLKAVRVIDDSVAPRFKSDDRLLVSPIVEKVLSESHNGLCLVLRRNGSIFIRFIRLNLHGELVLATDSVSPADSDVLVTDDIRENFEILGIPILVQRSL